MFNPKGVLSTVLRDLNDCGKPYALVGALAVSVHAEERTTKDIDFAVSVRNEREAR